MKRRIFLASSLGALGLAGCTSSVKTALTDGPFHRVLVGAEKLNHAVIGTHGMAREYRDADVVREFRVNSLDTPTDALYTGIQKDHWSGYRLVVDGLVDQRRAFSLAALRALPQQTQITRHDCVEGWSQIGKWRGVRLADVLAQVVPKVGARYVIFSCFDSDGTSAYYESLDLHEAAHPQTLLSLDLNDAPLDAAHGAPVRLRVPTQLGYKSAKWVHRIELASTFAGVGGGNGGYWEDQGYEWYAGI